MAGEFLCGDPRSRAMVIIRLELSNRRLGAKAFWTTLSVKQTGYKETLKWLKEILERTKCGKLQRSMERIASRHSISKKIKY